MSLLRLFGGSGKTGAGLFRGSRPPQLQRDAAALAGVVQDNWMDDGAPAIPVVCVHGSWHDGGAMQDVAALLQARGQPFYAPTLAGHGPLAGARVGITMAHCVESVVNFLNLLRDQGMPRVHLLGWSFGGAVEMAVLEHFSQTGDLESRIASALFLSAFIPQPGKSCGDMLVAVDEAQGSSIRAGLSHLAAVSPAQDYTCLMPYPLFRGMLLPEQVTERGEQVDDDWVHARVYDTLHPEPWRPFEEPVDAHNALTLLVGGALPSAYLLPPLDEGPAPGFWRSMADSLGPSCQLIALAAGGHECMFTFPSALAEGILAAVAAVRSPAMCDRLNELPSQDADGVLAPRYIGA